MNAPQNASADVLKSRSAEKHAGILSAATQAFLRRGFEGTSMDEIAAAARVSKQTMYKHFADKERLFAAVIDTAVREAGDEVCNAIENCPETGDLHADLREIARVHLEVVTAPHIMQLRRIVISTVDRFPSLGRAFYEEGPARAVKALAGLIERLQARGELVVENSMKAAADFNCLTLSMPINAVMFLGQQSAPAPEEFDAIADRAARVFIAAYAPRAG